MNAKTLAELALKVWGALLVLGAVLSLPSALWMVWTVPPGDAQAAFMRASQVGYMLNLVVQAVTGIVVLVWADRIVGLFESDVTPLDIDISNAQLQVLAFAVVGIFVLIDGLQNAAAAGYVLLTKPDQADTWSYMWARQGEGLTKVSSRSLPAQSSSLVAKLSCGVGRGCAVGRHRIPLIPMTRANNGLQPTLAG
jgi:hypothetical protein